MLKLNLKPASAHEQNSCAIKSRHLLMGIEATGGK